MTAQLEMWAPPLKRYTQAPLPFVGQKRYFLKAFAAMLAEHIPGNGEGWTIIDVFGGSGLLAHNAKRLKPAARVIYNNFDGYTERLAHIPDTNRLRRLLADVLADVPSESRLNDVQRQRVMDAVAAFDGAIDWRCLASWLLFSNKKVEIDAAEKLFDQTLFKNVRKTDIPEATDYLDGLEITRECFEKLIPQHADNPKALLLLDPPYVSTAQGAYAAELYFGMVSFLKLMSLIRPPFVLFGSTRSDLLDYFDYLQTYHPEQWALFAGYQAVQIQTCPGKNSSYEDNMIYKFGGKR